MDAHIKDTLKEARREARLAAKEGEALYGLTQMEGWKVFLKIVEERANAEAKVVFAPASSMDDALRAEYAKGAFNAYQSLVGVIMTKIDEFQKANASPENEEDDGEAPPPTPPPTNERF